MLSCATVLSAGGCGGTSDIAGIQDLEVSCHLMVSSAWVLAVPPFERMQSRNGVSRIMAASLQL